MEKMNSSEQRRPIVMNYPPIKIMLAPRVICIHNPSWGAQSRHYERAAAYQVSCDKHTYYGSSRFLRRASFLVSLILILTFEGLAREITRTWFTGWQTRDREMDVVQRRVKFYTKNNDRKNENTAQRFISNVRSTERNYFE